MADWLQRARLEIPKGPTRPPVNRAVRGPETPETALTALSAASLPDPFAGIPTAAEEAEIRAHLIRLLPGEDHADFAEALALALADPVTHLEGLRLSTEAPEVLQ